MTGARDKLFGFWDHGAGLGTRLQVWLEWGLR